MSYVNLIRTQVHQALKSGGYLGDIPTEIIYYSGDEGDLATYDPVTQLVTKNETTGTGITAVYTEAEERQIDGVNVLKNDKFFFISALNLTNKGITSIKPNDRIEFLGAKETVMRAFTDPTRSLWTVQTRIP